MKTFFNKIYKKFPEHRFGFWKSPKSNDFANKVYFSIENWIVPPETDFKEAIKFHSGLENEIKFEKAEVVYYKGKTILLTDSTAIYFYQTKQLNNSIKCLELVFYRDDNTLNQKKNIEKDLFGEPVKHKKKRINYSKEIEIIENDLKYSISEFGDIICIEYKNYNHVFFTNDFLTFEEINAANVIMQYGAKGYGVFTTTVIDSTLYDMLDGFKKYQEIDVSFCWSKYELERYLNRYQFLKYKYFK